MAGRTGADIDDVGTRDRIGRAGAVLAAFAVVSSSPFAPQARAEEPGGRPGAADAARDERLVETYGEMLADDPYEEYAFRRLLEVSHAAGGIQGLIERWQKRAGARPDDASARVVLGHLYRAADRDGEAAQSYEEAARLLPKDPGPHFALGHLHCRAQRWDEADAAFGRAAELARARDRKQQVLKDAAECSIEAKRLDRAEAWFRTLVETEPGNVFLRMEKATVLLRTGHPERALAAWKEVREKAGNNLRHLVVVWRRIAELEAELGLLDDAEATWREALAKTPAGHWARPDFLEGLVSLHRRKDALKELIAELEPEAKRSHEVRVVVARLYEETGQDRTALDLLRKVIRERPSDVAVRLRAIAILERVGDPDEVIAAYKDLVRAVPGEPRHELRLAEITFQRGRTKEGFDLLTRLASRHPTDPGVHSAIVDLTIRYGTETERPRVEKSYRTLMRLEPAEESHVVSLGEYYWSRGDRDRAHAVWRKLLPMGDGPGEGWFLLAEVYADHGLAEEAARAFEAAIEKDPENPRFARAYALWLEKERRFAEGLSWWKRIVDAPRDAADRKKSLAAQEARRHMIDLWEKTGTLEAETKRLEAAFAADPPDLEAGYTLAEAWQKARRLEDALRVLERLSALEPGSLAALSGLEAVYTRQNRLRKAIEVLERMAKENPRSAYEYFHRAADLALALGDDPLALEFTRRVVSLNPADPGAHARVGDLFVRMHRLAEAAEAWRQALALDPRGTPVRFKLASLYRDLGQPLREEQVLVDVVRESNDPADVLRAGRRLLQVASASGRLDAVESALAPLVAGRTVRHDVHLKLLVDVYAGLARELRWSEKPAPERDAALLALGERALEPLLGALSSTDVAIRARALQVLRLTRPSGAVSALLRLAREPDAMTRFQAAVALGGSRTPSAVEALSHLLESGEADVRDVAIWALGATGAPEAAPAILPVLARGPSSQQTRVVACLALGLTGSLSALPDLHRLSADGDRGVRLAALWALSRIGHAQSIEVLERALTSPRPPEVRVAAWGLSRIDDDRARRALAGALWREGTESQGLLLRALSASGDRREDPAIRSIYAAFADGESPALRVDIGALAGLSRPTTEHADLGRARPFVEERVAALMSDGSRTDLVRLLVTLAGGDPDPGLSGLLGPELVLPHAEPLLGAAAGNLGREARGPALLVAAELAATGRPGSERAGLSPARVAEVSLEALASPDPRVREAGARALSRLEGTADPRVEEALARAVSEPGEDGAGVRLRAVVAESLGRRGGPVAVETLGRLLRDPSAEVRIAAVRAVAALDPPAHLSSQIDLLDDPVPDVARAAVRAIGASSDPRAREALARAARSPDPRIGLLARQVLEAASPP